VALWLMGQSVAAVKDYTPNVQIFWTLVVVSIAFVLELGVVGFRSGY
jgi:hypothetical protein